MGSSDGCGEQGDGKEQFRDGITQRIANEAGLSDKCPSAAK